MKTLKPTCECGGDCGCDRSAPKKEKSKTESILKLFEAHSEKVNGLWDEAEKVRIEIANFEDAVAEIQNDYDTLYDDIKFILDS
jgi:predicted component of type VI protein secretion system